MNATAWTLVTGATGVVGRAIVLKLLAEGRSVCATYGEDLDTLKHLQYAASTAGTLIAVNSDLKSPDAGERLLEEIEGKTGPICSFIHAAALVDHTSFDDLGPARFLDVLAVNVVSAYSIARALVRRGSLREVVLLSSIASKFTDLGSVAYVTSKGAIDALTRALDTELGPTVRVNAVAPGIIRSYRTDSDPLFSGPAARIPQAGLVDPDDIAELTTSLLDGNMPSVRGQIIYIDSGVTRRLL